MESNISPHFWEYAIVGKIFFDAEFFLVALQDDNPVGFIHATLPVEHINDKPTRGIINAFCVRNVSGADEIAGNLLDEILRLLAEKDIRDISALGSPTNFSQYLMVTPLFGMLGVPAADRRLQTWLTSRGFRSKYPIDLWELALTNIRTQMDRGQIAVRRSCNVSRVLSGENPSWFLANAFGHAEQMRFSLAARGEERMTQELEFYYLEHSPLRATLIAQVYLRSLPVDPIGIDQMVFLLSESLRQLQYERFSSVIAFTQADDQSAVELLRRLSFRSIGSGVVYAFEPNTN
jgi:hypothetical protein